MNCKIPLILRYLQYSPQLSVFRSRSLRWCWTYYTDPPYTLPSSYTVVGSKQYNTDPPYTLPSSFTVVGSKQYNTDPPYTLPSSYTVVGTKQYNTDPPYTQPSSYTVVGTKIIYLQVLTIYNIVTKQ